MKNAILIKNLTKKFPGKEVLALNKVNITVKEGDWHGFIGPNGAGKTTTIKTLIGAINPTNGSIDIFGLKAGTIESKKLIGYVPEKAVFERGRSETTYKYLYEMGRMNELSIVETRMAIRRVAKLLKISSRLLNRNPISFSSGEKRKILIAQALLHNPKLLILDEPAANLDPPTRRFVLTLLKDLTMEKNLTIFISSHVLSELQRYVTGWTFINNGKILENKSLENTKNDFDITYEISSNENDNLKKLLLSKGFVNFEHSHVNDSLIFHIKGPILENKFRRIVFSSKFLITTFKRRSVDLEELYQSLKIK